MKRSDDAIDRAARYAQLGRRYQHLRNHELGRRWAEAFGATVARPDDKSARLLQEDLFAEHQLRRINPPYEAVSRERDHLVAELLVKMSELNLLGLTLLKIPAGHSAQRRTCEKQ
jgi:hypothetical protein